MNDAVSIQPYAVRNGLILGAISVVTTLVSYATDLYLNPSAGWVMMGISLVLMIVFMLQTFKAFKQQTDGYMSLGQGFKGGFIMTLVSALISTTVSYVYLSFIDPGVLKRSMDLQREIMAQNPDLTEAQIDQAMGFAEKFATPEVTAISGIIMAVIFGAVVSLIMAAIAKKDYETY